MEILYWFESVRNPALDLFFSLVTRLGEETFFLVLALAIFWCVDKRRGYYLMTVGFVGTVANQFLKLAFRIPRPWVRDPDFTIVESAREGASGYSFPSGHTQTAVGVYGGLARSGGGWLRRAALVLAVLIPVSRLYLGVHTIWDVGVSAVIGLALVLALWPLFRWVWRRPERLYAVLGAVALLAAAYTAYVELWPFPADLDPENYAAGLKNGYTLLGASAGVLLAAWLDGRYLRFSTQAPPLGQALKLVLGLILALAVKEGLKLALPPLLHGHPAADAVRYFLVVLAAGGLWPLTFPWFARIGQRR